MAFDTCASAGCHNFHDNRALYEDFLVKHMDEPIVTAAPRVPRRNFSAVYRQQKEQPLVELQAEDANHPSNVEAEDELIDQWADSAHAKAQVNCADCHQSKSVASGQWQQQPSEQACEKCHALELEGFTQGKHGMRLAQELPPMEPRLARQKMSTKALNSEKGHAPIGCSSCHTSHRYDSRRAATEACLSCHGDEHSLAFKKSPHYRLWQEELEGEKQAGKGVSCATCHLPRIERKHKGIKRIVVEHNQNHNLRPNEKMIREVCMNCHGLGFSIDALADAKLIKNNFNGEPSRHIDSIEMAKKREVEKAKEKKSQEDS
jgi:hypothetical protein